MFGGASERWLWQQGGRDVREGGGVQGSLFLGCGAVQQHRLWLVQWMLWGANILLGFGDRISWLAATRGCPAPAPELPLLGITAASLSVLEEQEKTCGFFYLLFSSGRCRSQTGSSGTYPVPAHRQRD